MEQRHHLFHLGADGRVRELSNTQAIGDVFKDSHVRKKGIVLEDGPGGPGIRGPARNPFAADKNVAFIWLVEPGDTPQGRGFAAAARAQERGQLSLPKLEAHPVQRNHFAPVTEPFGDSL